MSGYTKEFREKGKYTYFKPVEKKYRSFMKMIESDEIDALESKLSVTICFKETLNLVDFYWSKCFDIIITVYMFLVFRNEAQIKIHWYCVCATAFSFI